MSTDHTPISNFIHQLNHQESLRARRIQQGVPALQRLIDVAQGDTHQSAHCRRILLGLYNGFEWPLDLRRLRVLDPDLQRAALAVIELDWVGHEIHTYLHDGDEIFQQFWERETPRLQETD
ncbi:DUF7673 family protein [Marinobacter lutaoensis]|uniref:DUF7673 family protein n=1 Tax=Marinobacter lutaoensis TaxID=135739 RepID=UPI001594160F|nr:hypothetical protein [Marinobacter lutaoensis]NVD34352.1 hypothetical protein [Marinobacter lutaoensis]